MTKNKQPNLIASLKMLNIGVINKYTINLTRNRGMGGGGGAIQYYLITNHSSQISFL